jgi:hypothetical protein
VRERDPQRKRPSRQAAAASARDVAEAAIARRSGFLH